MDNSADQNEKISIKEIHETLWRCRDFELSHLWQRSIFLSAVPILNPDIFIFDFLIIACFLSLLN